MSKDIHPKQIDSLRKMTPAQRLNIAFEFMEEMRKLMAAALRAQHPGLERKANRARVAQVRIAWRFLKLRLSSRTELNATGEIAQRRLGDLWQKCL